jgi:3-mercaptopyruvate sulfurtransferase SseA
VAFYCGTGWGASETWFYAYLMGWARIAVYDGGWFEWSQDPISNPIEVGEPRDEFAA